MNIFKKTEVDKSYIKLKKKLKESYKTAKILVKEGLLYTDIQIGCYAKYIISVKTIEEMLITRNRLKKIFKDYTFEFSSWSPYGNKVICQWMYQKKNIAIWLETDIDHLPPNLLKPTCKFIKQHKEKYTLVCEK